MKSQWAPATASLFRVIQSTMPTPTTCQHANNQQQVEQLDLLCHHERMEQCVWGTQEGQQGHPGGQVLQGQFLNHIHCKVIEVFWVQLLGSHQKSKLKAEDHICCYLCIKVLRYNLFHSCLPLMEITEMISREALFKDNSLAYIFKVSIFSSIIRFLTAKIGLNSTFTTWPFMKDIYPPP